MVKHKPTYNSWQAMKQRCLNPRNPDFFRYGGRGVKIGEELLTYEGFVEHLELRPAGMNLDRINTKGNYTWDNCRWTDQWRQNSNRGWEHYWTYEARGNIFVVFYYNGKAKSQEYIAPDELTAIRLVNNSGKYG